MVPLIRSISLFLVAGLCEIGGGYLVWGWMKKGLSPATGLLGALLLVIYGVLPTFQPIDNFGRVYAAYGGLFVVMSFLWGWKFDGAVPDGPDRWGALLCLVGVAIIMYWPRPAAISPEVTSPAVQARPSETP